jgi:hypothetical protein
VTSEITLTTAGTPGARPLSLSQIRLFHTCSYAWKLRYEKGHMPVQSAAAWRGTLAHTAIRLAHHGVPLETAHRHVWQRACGPVLAQLDAFLALDAAYAAAGRPQTKAAQQWRQDHPAYDAALAAIRSFQERALGHLRWSERASLADYYAASVRMLDHEPDIVLPNPILIEGEEPRAAHAGNILADAEMQIDEDDLGVSVVERRGYGLVPTTLGGLELHVVPDVVAVSTGGETMRVVDYKVSDRVLGESTLAEDAQLNLYVLGLRQNGYILPGQPIEMGHITLTGKGPAHVFVRVDESQHARVLRRLEALAHRAASDVASGSFVAQKGLHHPFVSPCATCDYAQVCDA